MSDLQEFDGRFGGGAATPIVPQRAGQATQVEQARAIAEVRAAVMIAMDRPRDRTAAVAEMREVCQITALAERAFFRVPRGGEHVNGESIHLARELARCWGNLAFGVKELARDDIRGQSELLAYAWDLQTNARSEITFIVPHVKGKANRRLTGTQEIYENNASFAGRRLRETIFAVLPVWFKAEAAEICHATLANGGGKPLVQRIADLRTAFEAIGITVGQIERKRGRRIDDFLPEDVAGLRVVYGSIKRGEVTVADEFPPEGGPTPPHPAGGKLDALESLANPEGHREGNDATTAETSPAAPEDETFNSASTAVRPSQETRRSAERDGSQGNAPPAGASGLPSHTNSPAAQPVHERNTDGSGGPASAGEPDQSASRPDAPPPVAGRPGADATLPAGLAPVEDASRRGDGPAPAGEATLDQWQGEVDMMASELGQSLGAAADERLTSHGLALGNRRNAANVSMRPQSDLLAERGEGSARPFATTDTAPSGGDGGSGDNRTRGGSGPTATTPASRSDLLGAPPAENLTVPLPARPTVGQLADFAQEVLLRIADAPPTPQRIALIKKQNEHGIGLLRAAAPEQYNEVQAALAMRAT